MHIRGRVLFFIKGRMSEILFIKEQIEILTKRRIWNLPIDELDELFKT